LTDPDPARRAEAEAFLLAMIEFGGRLGAPAIVGSLQGRGDRGGGREQALGWLAAALRPAAEAAARHGQSLLCEPLNRYETKLLNRLAESAGWLEAESLGNVLLLADLFHMNIEEADPAGALRAVGHRVGHVHFADSNRWAMGFGHTDPVPLIAALQASGFRACLSAEILPLPDPATAARRTIESLRALIPVT
jgi:sugar phosphate isomerase/epimerase